METIEITINRANVLADMRVKSHAEVAILADDRERYLAELGTEKLPLAHQCITDSVSEVVELIRPLLKSVTPESLTDGYDTDDILFSLEVSGRKADAIERRLAQAIHTYVVNASLARYYEGVSRVDIAERHRARLAPDMTIIEEICFHKNEPVYE